MRATGNFADLIELARAGKIRWDDQIETDAAADPFSPHALPPVGVHVPTREELRTIRNHRALIVFDSLLAATFLILSLYCGATGDPGGIRIILFLSIFSFALFGLPLFYIPKKRRFLERARLQGVFRPVPRISPGDRQFVDELSRRPVLTIALIVAIVATFVVTFFGGDERFSRIVLAWGASRDPIDAGQWWRLVAPMFLHFNAVHLFLNSMALYSLGRMIENIFGRFRFFLIFFIGGIAGFLASATFNESGRYSIGASGAVFALIGACLGFGWKHRNVLPPIMRNQFLGQMLIWIGINVALGLSLPIIDNYCHLGGLFAGIVFVLPLSPTPRIVEILQEEHLSKEGGAG